MATLVCRQLVFGYPGSESNIFDGLELIKGSPAARMLLQPLHREP